MEIKSITPFNIEVEYNSKIYKINDELVSINVKILIDELEDYIEENNYTKDTITDDIINEIIFLTYEYVNIIYEVNRFIMENKPRQYIDSSVYGCITKKPNVVKLYNNVISGNYKFKHKKYLKK